MQPNKENILAKTHFGLNIYTHILRQYDPEVVLSLAGRECFPIKNPFNNNRQSLKITIVNNLAHHVDLDNASDGDAFSFAAMHYKLDDQALFIKLNEAMHLQIDRPADFYNPKKSVHLHPACPQALPAFSFFKSPVTNIFPQKSITLLQVYTLIQSDLYQLATQSLRNVTDLKEARKYKAAHFDYVTFSGIFTRRNDNDLKQHSGLIALDFDGLQDPAPLRQQLLSDEYFETELLFVSPSGKGLKWIIPIDLAKATHLDYFKSISNYILHTYGFKVDPSGKDLSRACFLPHDPNIYINPKYA